MAGAFRSSIGGQLQAFLTNVRRFVYETLKLGARTFRRRMIRERLSGPPGLNRKTGNLIRSLDYTTSQNDQMVKLQFNIGGAGKSGQAAYYAEKYENEGRLGFRRLFADEAMNTIDAIRTGFALLCRTGGQAGGGLSFDLSGVGDVDAEGAGAAFAGMQLKRRVDEQEASAAAYDPKTQRGRRNLAPSREKFERAVGSLWNRRSEFGKESLFTPTGGSRESLLSELGAHARTMKARSSYISKFRRLRKFLPAAPLRRAA